jgi:hypothetical protein
MLSRRKMLAVGAGALTGLALRDALADPRRPIHGGWLNLDESRLEFLRANARPYLGDHGKAIKGDGRNKQISLIKHYERVTKKKFQPNFQEIGDCCGEAGTMGAQVLAATQIDLHKKNEEWKGPFSVEFTYASSRVEVGGGRIRRVDGSTGAWTSESMRRIGLLRREKYGQYDLRNYRPDLGRAWGRSGVGVPDELEKIAKEHPIKTVALVSSWDEACDCIANGFPVLLCSSVGYNQKTDKDGFLRHMGIIWYHAMLLAGIDTVSRRQGGLIVNSWGTDWLSGPQHALGTPAGCFWADAQNIEAAIREGDSFALSNFAGFPRRNLDYLLY